MHEDTRRWIEADKRHVWHPFTPQTDWTAAHHQPLVLVGGEGAWLIDSEGRRYLDGNSSIWTNIHGHRHPELDAAVRQQLDRVAHTSFLGFSNPRASELAERLTAFFPPSTLERVFFSDDGSTAVEAALKMAIQYRLQTGEPQRTRFIAFENGYHGDTMGAAALGGVAFFFERFRRFGMPVEFVGGLADLESLNPQEVAAVVLEPLIQGVNEMRVWPRGMLRELRTWCDRHGVHLILDEVMTGFGRTGSMFACQQEGVAPDFLCLAKGLSGGYLPLAATLTTRAIYDAFSGPAERAFYYGHSFTGSQLGCAAALASLDIFESEKTLERMQPRIQRMTEVLDRLAADCRWIHDIRQCGLIAGIELRMPGGGRFPADQKVGHHVCLAARDFGLLTRPIRDTLVLMPPLCVTDGEIEHAIAAVAAAIDKTLFHGA